MKENLKYWTEIRNMKILVVGPVLKIKTGFQGFETKRNPGFRKFTDICQSFTRAYMSYILNRKYGFARYFEVCKLHLP